MSGGISDRVISEVKDRADIVEVISSYIPVKRAGRTLKACCPFHKEKTPSFNVNGERQFYHCFGCGASGDVIKFVQSYENVDFITATTMLANKYNVMLEDFQPGQRKGPDKNSLYILHEEAAQWFQTNLQKDNAKPVRDYLASRGMTAQDIQKFRIGYAPESWDGLISMARQKNFSNEAIEESGLVSIKEAEHGKPKRIYDRFRNRLMFPIWNDEGKVIAFSGRILDKEAKGAKYVNSPETPIFHKSKVLYAINHARKSIKDMGHALLCEGQIDVIACHRAGMTNAISAQGTAFTEEHARKIKRYTENLVLAFDGDSAGQKAALKSLEPVLEAGLNSRVTSLPDGEDPDGFYQKYGADALANSLKQSKDFFEFIIDSFLEGKDLRNPAVKAEGGRAVLEQIIKLPDPIVRGSYCQMAAHRLQLPESALFDQLNKMHYEARQKKRFEHQRQQNNLNQQGAQQAFPQEQAPQYQTEQIPMEAMIQEELCLPAEKSLLDLALNFEHIADALVEELDASLISNSPVGQALNMVVGQALNGEWSDSPRVIADQFAQSKHVGELLVYSHFTSIEDQELIQKAFSDCLKQVKVQALQKAQRELMAHIRLAQEPEQSRQLKEQYMEVMRQLNELK